MCLLSNSSYFLMLENFLRVEVKRYKFTFLLVIYYMEICTCFGMQLNIQGRSYDKQDLGRGTQIPLLWSKLKTLTTYIILVPCHSLQGEPLSLSRGHCAANLQTQTTTHGFWDPSISTRKKEV
jgi:hypothetical protein